METIVGYILIAFCIIMLKVMYNKIKKIEDQEENK